MASTETGRIRRRRLLHACGVSAVTIAHNACRRAEEVQGPIGSLSKRIASVAGPIVSPMELQWLAFLSFADDGIFEAENMVETLFPSSAYVFDMIDSFVRIPEALPGTFDRMVDILPVIIRHVPFLRWSLTLFIWGLNFLLSTFTDGRPDDAANEKEITVDINCNELATPEQMMPQLDPIETTNHGNNEDRFASKSVSIYNTPATSPTIGDRQNRALFFNKASMDQSPHPPAASPPPSEREDEATYKKALMGNSAPPAAASSPPGERKDVVTYKKALMGNSPPPAASAPVAEPRNAAKEREIIVDISSNELEQASGISPEGKMPQQGLTKIINHALNREGHFAPKSASVHNSPLASPPIGDRENEANFKKALMGKLPLPPPAPVGESKTLQTKAERKATGTKTEKASYKKVVKMGNKAETGMKEGSVGKEEPKKAIVKDSVDEKADMETKEGRYVPILELYDAGWHMKPTLQRLGQFAILETSNSSLRILWSCISPVRGLSLIILNSLHLTRLFHLCPDGKRDNKKKKIHFAADVVDSIGNNEEFRRTEQEIDDGESNLQAFLLVGPNGPSLRNNQTASLHDPTFILQPNHLLATEDHATQEYAFASKVWPLIYC
ncbi:hypothetical protein NE237_020928 [Protea cynaroides]|uniref:Uncharacterized protein n=1 Tax=Protea cynaroides TaxID=273540 RepID=A0A9Q0H7J3_9MAGN|nr:hypothetical protein NE237_020928 [Protea cynaroides]